MNELGWKQRLVNFRLFSQHSFIYFSVSKYLGNAFNNGNILKMKFFKGVFSSKCIWSWRFHTWEILEKYKKALQPTQLQLRRELLKNKSTLLITFRVNNSSSKTYYLLLLCLTLLRTHVSLVFYWFILKLLSWKFQEKLNKNNLFTFFPTLLDLAVSNETLR